MAPPESSGPSDRAAPEAALFLTRSFIVQAPAGSGKTELLIQRFLALLARIERPEAIVAMTFTRKAAGEIRERIIDALREAAKGAQPSQPHRALTWRLARAALERDAALGWELIAHPAPSAGPHDRRSVRDMDAAGTDGGEAGRDAQVDRTRRRTACARGAGGARYRQGRQCSLAAPAGLSG
jgi:hypothetical protein